MKKYTAKDRRLAILICRLAAWRPEFHSAYEDAARALGIRANGRAYRLALEAWEECFDALGRPWTEDGSIDAEAEFLLRDGWSPGDPVVRLGGES